MSGAKNNSAMRLHSLGHLYGKFMERHAEKLRSITLLEFELITSRSAYGIGRKPLFHDFSVFERVRYSQIHLFSFLETPGNSK